MADYGFCVYQFNSYADTLYIEDTGIEVPVGEEVDLCLVNVIGNAAFFSNATVTNGTIAEFTMEPNRSEGTITANALGNTSIVVEGKSWRSNNYSVQIPVVVGDVVFNQAYYNANNDFNAKTVKHLEQIAELASDGNDFTGKTITLEGSLDLSASDFNGINITSGFMGIFDGNGNSVTVNISANLNELGFISALGSSGEVKDLTVKGNITNLMTSGGVAGIVGNNAGKISDCTNEAELSNKNYIAGIAVTNTGTIENCTNNKDLWCDNIAAGIVRNNKGTIKGCVNNGFASGKTAGGIVETNGNGGSISHCLNTGAVSGTGSSTGYPYAGGIVAEHTMNGGTIKNCTNTGSVSCINGHAGGIAGNSSSTITNSYNTGNVIGDYAGGIAGAGNTIEWCYNKGDISGTTYCGGVVGSIDVSLANCYAMNCTVKETATKAGAVFGNALNQAAGTNNTHMYVKDSSGNTWTGAATTLNNFMNVFDAGSSSQTVGYDEYDFY